MARPRQTCPADGSRPRPGAQKVPSSTSLGWPESGRRLRLDGGLRITIRACARRLTSTSPMRSRWDTRLTHELLGRGRRSRRSRPGRLNPSRPVTTGPFADRDPHGRRIGHLRAHGIAGQAGQVNKGPVGSGAREDSHGLPAPGQPMTPCSAHFGLSTPWLGHATDPAPDHDDLLLLSFATYSNGSINRRWLTCRHR
jgi:hypothetical protein